MFGDIKKQDYYEVVSQCCVNVIEKIFNTLYLFTIYTFLHKVCQNNQIQLTFL